MNAHSRRHIQARAEHGTHVRLAVTASLAPSSEEDQERLGPSHPSGSGLGQESVERQYVSSAQATTTAAEDLLL